MPSRNRRILLSELPLEPAEPLITEWFSRGPADIHDDVRTAIESLPPIEREVIKRRYGFEGPEETLASIARERNLSRERIRQIQKRAIGSLRDILNQFNNR
jgi:DNA-directed RNA polymerase sigma subunit (sigma70/sigma32)